MNGNGQFNISDLKLPPDWDLMTEKQQEDFMKRQGKEPDNIIPFRDPQHIDLTNCF